MSRRIVVVGDLVTDVIVQPHAAIVHGTDTAASISFVAGGSAANTAAWIGALGGPVDFVGRTGQDQHDWHDGLLTKFGVRAFITADSNLPPARIVVLVDPNGERTMLTDRGANDALSPNDVEHARIDNQTIVHVSGYTLLFDGPRPAGLFALAQARASGASTSVDPNSSGFLARVGAARFLEMTAGVDICFPNADEVCALTDLDDPVDAAIVLTRHYDTVACKLGAQGALVARAGAIVARSSAPEVAVVDTTGAGDAFAAGYLLGFANGCDAVDCLDRAIATSGQAVSIVGARPLHRLADL